jgi:hypothetical protein
MNKEGVLYFHQGWTDIINCLSLINYYTSYYNKIYLVVRTDSNKIINFYTKIITNLEIIYIDKNILDNINIVEYLNNNNLSSCDYLFHGFHDNNRKDLYFNSFSTKIDIFNICFVKAFYEFYNINYMLRINFFNFERNHELENKIYEEFINLYGNEYILNHEINEVITNNIQSINLNGMSEIFFDYIKVLENAKEIHLLDSIWGAFIYLLDCRYKLFENKKIYLYAKRGYTSIFIEPLKLNNWIFV